MLLELLELLCKNFFCVVDRFLFLFVVFLFLFLFVFVYRTSSFAVVALMGIGDHVTLLDESAVDAVRKIPRNNVGVDVSEAEKPLNLS